MFENKDNSITVPNHLDNISTIDGLDTQFKSINKLVSPEIVDAVEAEEILDFETFIKLNNPFSDEESNLNIFGK